MILIIEGPDGAGKTRLAQSIKGARYHHEGPPPPGEHSLLAYYLGIIDQKVQQSPIWAPFVFDRLAMGEAVYGPILRGGSRITDDELRRFFKATRELRAFHVLCLPPFKTCRANWEARRKRNQELITDHSAFERAYSRFESYKPWFDLVYDYTEGAK